MRNGKGISVPRLGNFTFSATLVDLAVCILIKIKNYQGTTNPSQRDQQQRVPVFIVGKDFVSAVNVKAGVAAQGGTTVRPYDVKGASGIIPKVKINYTEVASFAGAQFSKDLCRNGCEQVFRFLSDKVRRGEPVTMDLPFVGTFIVRNQVAGVAFSNELQQDTLGVTARGHFVNKLFASSVNRLNMQIADQNQGKQKGLGGALAVGTDAEEWLNKNLAISVQDILSRPANSRHSQRIQSAHQDLKNSIQPKLNRYGSMRPEDLKMKSWAINQDQGSLTEQNKDLFDKISQARGDQFKQSKRPMSAVTRSSQASRVTSVPEVGRMKLMQVASSIHQCRSSLAEALGKQSMRDILSSGELLTLARRANIHIDLLILKALLRDLGFNYNGPACSLYDFLQGCKTYLYGKGESYQPSEGHYETAPLPRSDLEQSRNAQSLLQFVKDLFYASKRSVFQLYSSAKLADKIDFEGFKKIVGECQGGSPSINDSELREVFKIVSKGKDSVTYQEFEKVFKWELPTGPQWETACIRAIREWMFKNSLSSQTSFELICKLAGKQREKVVNRIEWHKGMSQLPLGFSAMSLDSFFAVLDFKQDGILDSEEWEARIYEDSNNPLQLLREVVSNNKLTPDDILQKMQLRIWDEPLSFSALSDALRKLDPTLSEPQLRHLAKSLRSGGNSYDQNKVEVTTLLRNLCGQQHETVDYRNKIFRQIYDEIHPNKEDQLLQLLEQADPLNDGRVEPQGLKAALKGVVKSVDEEGIERFVRFLDKDRQGKIPYLQFLQQMQQVSNRDHNPLKATVQRISYFLQTNNQSIPALLKRLSKQDDQSQDYKVSVEAFGAFLKNKIDKKRSIQQLTQFAHCLDIDKDGFISQIDLQTCLENINSETFYKNSGESLAESAFSSQKKFYPSGAKALTQERAQEIVKQIRTSLTNQRIAFREAFNRFDTNKKGFLSFSDFSQGLDKVLQLSAPVKEKLFAFMDQQGMGLIDYPSFLETLQLSSASQKQKKAGDNFEWEQGVINQIKQWIFNSKITLDEAFKSFDRDFDGQINKDDLKWALEHILQISPEAIQPTKLDRLFRLMDFYKTNAVQLSDFQRLLTDENQYVASGSRSTPASDHFRKSFGGSFTQTSTFDWKLSAIQQIGLHISKQFSCVRDAFEEASEHLGKVTFEQFKRFVEKHNALQGFNLTNNLTQQLFSEIDPHKKGYIVEQDWSNAFQAFNWGDQVFIELRNAIQCSFSDCDSAFQFFLTFKSNPQAKSFSYAEFETAANSLTSNRFSRTEIQRIWRHLTDGGKVSDVDRYQFRSHFDQLKYSGNSSVRKVKTSGSDQKSIGAKARTTIVTQNSSNSQWDEDIFEKLRSIIHTSAFKFEEIFKSFDTQGNGTISEVEFRNAMRQLKLGLTSRELDKLMAKIDLNSEGRINYVEFMAKFKNNDLDNRLKERAKDKMARLKEMMILHMTSQNDAFRFFDESKHGKLTYQEFSKLVLKLHELCNENPPTYPVIKDLFDTIDIRKDGIIDINEWQQTFGNVVEGNNKLTIRATPLSMWENSREFHQIGSAIAKNRKLLKEQFENITGGKTTEITFEQAKKALNFVLSHHFKGGINDQKLKCILRVGELQGATAGGPGTAFDYDRILDVYKNRHAGPQL